MNAHQPESDTDATIRRMRTASLTDPTTWQRTGRVTHDGLAIVINPATGNYCVRDPGTGTLYSVEVWPDIRKRRAEGAAMEMLEALKLCVSRDPSLKANAMVMAAIAKAEGK